MTKSILRTTSMPIRDFIVRCIGSLIPMLYIRNIPKILLDFAAENAGLSLIWLKDKFQYVVAHY